MPPPAHSRRSLRLPAYDYTQPGAYFVTLVTQGREAVFGACVRGVMQLNEIGRIAQEEWFHSADLRPCVHLYPDEFIVMPNHIHGIIWMVDPLVEAVVGAVVGAQRAAPLPEGRPSVQPASLAAIVRAYKSAVTRRANLLTGTAAALLWQRNYYESILHTDSELERVRAYICSNPLKWELDQENPSPKEHHS